MTDNIGTIDAVIEKALSKYDKIIEHVFNKNFKEGDKVISITREQLAEACTSLDIGRIKNLGDIPYSYRFRRNLPTSVVGHAPTDSEWIIVGSGVGKYEFRLASPAKISPSDNRQRIRIPDATPEIVKKYAPGTDEQALLTKVRYNRLVDLFTGLTCYSIQNHLRTTVTNIGQIEIDEIYLGISKKGAHYVIPCQAKSPGDRFGIVQVMQDIAFCRARYPNAICKPIALQFLTECDVAMLELAVQVDKDVFRLSVVDEKHYQLTTKDGIVDTDITAYRDSEQE
ncbi:endonuclease [Rhodoferax antarcticus]|nr:endonuclease [Rhodoferax antarcticus]APW45510.1 endonuclease [Rhodoferax antarcticus]